VATLHRDDALSIGAVAERTGVAISALRFYEAEGLISSARSGGGQRRFPREALRRIAFIRVAQQVGLSLDEIRAALASLPDERTPTAADWARLSRTWRSALDKRIRLLELVRDDLASCIGCGCLSLQSCRLYNPEDRARVLGQGPRYLLGDTARDVVPELPRAQRRPPRRGS
jgi:MerR family transcriptional regulator, redox-sensitive transcriptional activator SoxR